MAEDPSVEQSTDESRSKGLVEGKQKNIPATKQFVVNATGNLYVATTLSSPDTPQNLSEEAEEAFGQVSVFFAAMTKAMDESGKSLFDYEALNQVIKHSGLFVNISKSDVDFRSSTVGATFSNNLISAMLGLSSGVGLAASLKTLINSIGNKSVKVAKSETENKIKIGTIIFICEYLMGAVSITPLVFSIDTSDSDNSIEVGPCLKTQSVETRFKIQKEVHLFVPPKFIHHAAEINDAMKNPEFKELVDKMVQDIQKADA